MFGYPGNHLADLVGGVDSDQGDVWVFAIEYPKYLVGECLSYGAYPLEVKDDLPKPLKAREETLCL